MQMAVAQTIDHTLRVNSLDGYKMHYVVDGTHLLRGDAQFALFCFNYARGTVQMHGQGDLSDLVGKYMDQRSSDCALTMLAEHVAGLGMDRDVLSQIKIVTTETVEAVPTSTKSPYFI